MAARRDENGNMVRSDRGRSKAVKMPCLQVGVLVCTEIVLSAVWVHYSWVHGKERANCVVQRQSEVMKMRYEARNAVLRDVVLSVCLFCATLTWSLLLLAACISDKHQQHLPHSVSLFFGHSKPPDSETASPSDKMKVQLKTLRCACIPVVVHRISHCFQLRQYNVSQ